MDSGVFIVEWISLGSAFDEEVAKIAANLTFNDIFKYRCPNITEFPDNGR